MIDRFTASGYAIVTARTDADHLGMINRARRDRHPRYRTRLMTGIALIAGFYMLRTLT